MSQQELGIHLSKTWLLSALVCYKKLCRRDCMACFSVLLDLVYVVECTYIVHVCWSEFGMMEFAKFPSEHKVLLQRTFFDNDAAVCFDMKQHLLNWMVWSTEITSHLHLSMIALDQAVKNLYMLCVPAKICEMQVPLLYWIVLRPVCPATLHAAQLSDFIPNVVCLKANKIIPIHSSC